MAHVDVNQAITNCKDKTYREVLPLLESLVIGPSQGKSVYATETLATAMHRIASTGASDAYVLAEVHGDRRFQALVQEVENRLGEVPQQFKNQSLANVVWGAGKLRLSQRRELFNAVEREVLTPRRVLSSFTPQQLAAIAWGFVAAEVVAPKLFHAIQDEAQKQPTLDDLLKKAGLLQHLQQRGQANALLGMHQGQWNQGGAAQYPTQGMQGSGGGVSAPASARPPIHNNGLVVPGSHTLPSGGQIPMPQPQAPISYSSSQYMHPVGGAAGANRLPPAAAQMNGAPAAVPTKQFDAVSNRPDVAIAAEEHKKEMERKQREVLGDADSEWTCPLCIEPMDDTDISFLPCPCGYQICRLCYHRIVNLETKTCPACRAEYKEENIQKKSLPEKKKGDAEPGWESGAGKKKAKDKKPVMPTYAGFNAKVRELLLHCHEIGHVVKGELDERILEDLKALPERGAVAVLNEFIKKDMSRIRNKCAFLHRIIQRVQEEHQNDKSAYEKYAAAGAGGAPAASINAPPPMQGPPYPPQRARAVSDVGVSQKNGNGGGGSSSNSQAPPPAAVMGIGDYSHPKGLGWAEKENGRQAYACNGTMGGMDLHPDAYPAVGECIPSELIPPRRQVDEYLQSRPSLQLPGAYRQGNNIMVDPSARYRDPIGSGAMIPPPQVNALKTAGKEALSPAAGAEAGSRLLAMLQGGPAQPHGVTQFGERKQEKPPLFARAGGMMVHSAGRDPTPAAHLQAQQLSHRNGGYGPMVAGMADEELLDMIARGDPPCMPCRQCGQRRFGDVDTSDGHFYCEDCWKAFELSRGDSSVLSLVNL